MIRSWPLVVLLCFYAGSALAQAPEDERPGVAVRLSPYVAPRPPDQPPDPGARYLYAFELAPGAWPSAEVVADRRLLRFEVHPEGSRRRYRCAHPDAPRTVPDGRVMRIGAGAEQPRWQEWVDLRMYCWGRALDALDRGARVEVAYGFPRRGRDRWVARPVPPAGSEPDPHDAERLIEGPELTIAAKPEAPAPEGPVRVELRARDVSRGAAVTFPVGIYANEGTHRVYLRDDLVSFVVDGPLGRVTCAAPRQTIVPIIDFYSRLRGRRGARTSIAASRWCPEGTFDIPGVYDVTPVVDLVYGGERYGIEAVTGRIEGRPTPIRVRHGGEGYVEQTLEEHAPPHAHPDGPV